MTKELKNKEAEKKSFFANLLDALESFAIAVACVVFIFLFVARLSIVNGDSMNKTLSNNDYLIVVNPFFTYEPKNGDIVVIHGNYENYSVPLVKRVIATEGQTITINTKTKQVFVDGELLNEEYAYYMNGIPLKRPWTAGGKYNSDTGEFTATVPEGHVFVMGDNRCNSADSRLEEISFVNENNILGKAVYRVSPFSNMGKI